MENLTGTAAAMQAEAEFAGLVREHQSMVFSLAYHFLHDRAAAEEVAQDVFLEMHRRLGGFESPEHARNWLRRVVSHRSIDAARRRGRHAHIALEDAPEPASPAPPRDPMLSGLLRKLVAGLPEKQRMIVILRYQEDLDAAEIAAVLEIPVGTVKSSLQRSLALLRDKLARHGGGV